MSRRKLREPPTRVSVTPETDNRSTYSDQSDISVLVLRSRGVDRGISSTAESSVSPLRVSQNRRNRNTSHFSTTSEPSNIIQYGLDNDADKKFATPLVRRQQSGCLTHRISQNSNEDINQTNVKSNFVKEWCSKLWSISTTVSSKIVSTGSSCKEFLSGTSSSTFDYCKKQFSWLKQKQQTNLWLWLWFPLFLLFLSCIYWWSEPLQRITYASLSHFSNMMNIGWTKAPDLVKSFYGYISSTWTTVNSAFIYIGTNMWSMVKWIGNCLTCGVYGISSLLNGITLIPVFQSKKVSAGSKSAVTAGEYSDLLQHVISSEEFTTYLDAHLNSIQIEQEQLMMTERERFKLEINALRDKISTGHSKDFSSITSKLSAMQNEHAKLLKDFSKVSESLEEVQKQMEKNGNGNSQLKATLEETLIKTQKQMDDIIHKIQVEKSAMKEELSRCCHTVTPQTIRTYVEQFWSSIFGLPDDSLVSLGTIKKSLQGDFIDKQHMERELKVASANIEKGVAEYQNEYLLKLKDSLDAEIIALFEKHQESHLESNEYSNISNVHLTTSQIEDIANKLIMKYDADKTGLADHALESAGGSIVATKCTEDYNKHSAALYFWGFRLYTYSTNDPRSMIQSSRNPGDCYAFKGTQGEVLIKLAGPVQLTGFTLEHIPKSISPRNSIDSAPQNFSVYGLLDPNMERVLIGEYQYKDNNISAQYFPVQYNRNTYFPFVEFNVTSNHGNVVFTCVYRFRVHGFRQP